MKRKMIFLFLALALCLTLLPAANAAEIVVPGAGNENGQNYRTWATTIKSHLYDNGSGLTRVEYIGETEAVLVEDYSYGFELQRSRVVEKELSIWGGFFAGETYNFFIFGQRNTEEDDSKEVYRVVKYSKDWERLGQASLFGANTTVPFDAGTVRFAEYGGMLYVRTCHEMYTSSDGLNHQASVTFSVRESDMEITDSFYGVMNSRVGYVSHSFNQFILVDEDANIITLDHGDAYPRSLVLMRYPDKAGADTFVPDYWNGTTLCHLVKFDGAIGQNSTGASVGGLAETRSGYVAVYNWDGGEGSPRGAYLSYLPKDFQGGDDAARYNLSPSGDKACSTPVLADVDLDGGWVLWTVSDKEQVYTTSEDSLQVCYAPYTADGTVGTVQQAPGAKLSDCKPIPYRDGVVWYVTSGGKLTFYTLDQSGIRGYDATTSTLSDWAGDEVAAAITAGVVPAELQRAYNTNITRKEFCQVMMAVVEKSAGVSVEEYLDPKGLVIRNPFEDTEDRAVLAAYALGIVNGDSDTTFHPDRAISRQEAAAMMARTCRELGIEGGEGIAFADADQFADWAAQHIAYMSGLTDPVSGKQVINGVGGNRFAPYGACTREQSYAMALRVLRCSGK